VINITFLVSRIKLCNLHILGLAETHLTGDKVVSIKGYQWYGFNRKNMYESNADLVAWNF